MLSASCSRHSWPAWARRPTPIAANTARCVRRVRRLAATLTEKPSTPSSTAASPMASRACLGVVSSALCSRVASWSARTATDSPAGKWGTWPPWVLSHNVVTDKGIPWPAASTSLTDPRSAISAWFRPKTVGNLVTDATIRSGTEDPPTGMVRSDPMCSRVAAR